MRATAAVKRRQRDCGPRDFAHRSQAYPSSSSSPILDDQTYMPVPLDPADSSPGISARDLGREVPVEVRHLRVHRCAEALPQRADVGEPRADERATFDRDGHVGLAGVRAVVHELGAVPLER